MQTKISGFTLLEILIALFIFTILSFIMASGLRSITNIHSRTEKRAERLSELQLAILTISSDLEQTFNRPTTGTNGLEPAFIGSPKSINFTHGGLANPLGQLPRSTLQRTQYSLNNGNLIRSTWPVLDHTGKLPAEQRVLLHKVKSLQFRFLDSQRKFLPSWPPPDKPQTGLPNAVHMVMVLQDMGTISQLYAIPVDTLDEKIGPPSLEKPE